MSRLTQSIGEMLRHERLSRDLSQCDVANLMGVQQSWVGKIERNCKSLASLEAYADAIGSSLKIDVDQSKSTRRAMREGGRE